VANNLTHATALRTDQANLATGTTTTFAGGTNQKIIGYSGTAPANAAAALSGNTVLFTITLVTWGAASAGVATVSASTAETNATSGTVTFYRRYKTDGTTVITQGLVATSAAEMTVASTTIATGATVTLTAGGTYTAPL
jgi:hypothetical protein